MPPLPPIPGMVLPDISPAIPYIPAGIYKPGGICMPPMPIAGVIFGGMIPVFSEGVGGIVENVLMGGSIS